MSGVPLWLSGQVSCFSWHLLLVLHYSQLTSESSTIHLILASELQEQQPPVICPEDPRPLASPNSGHQSQPLDCLERFNDVPHNSEVCWRVPQVGIQTYVWNTPVAEKAANVYLIVSVH